MDKDPYYHQGQETIREDLFFEPANPLASSPHPLPPQAEQTRVNRGPDPHLPSSAASAQRSALQQQQQQQQQQTRPTSRAPTSPLRHSCTPSNKASLNACRQHTNRHHYPRSDPTKISSGSPTMSFTGDGRMPSRGWFTHGAASPVSSHSQVVTPTQSQPFPNPDGKPSIQRNVSTSSSSSVFSIFRSSRAPAASQVAPDDKEFLSMDVDKALFPSGVPSDQDVFSPAAFRNLQMNATGLLRKFQAAYQYRAEEARELRAEATDVIEDADAKVHHLKRQLEAMAQKASEHEAVMHALMEELNSEKKLRLSDSETRDPVAALASLAGSTMSEDLYAEEDQNKRAWRRSAATIKSDLSFDTDEESVEEISVFSRSRSPTIATTASSDLDVMPPPPVPSKPTMTAVHPRSSRPPTITTPPAPAQLTTLQKLWKGMSSPDMESRLSMSRCRNCQGQDASVAWDTVGLLRDENKGLKQRVGDLETAVESALDAVNGINMDL